MATTKDQSFGGLSIWRDEGRPPQVRLTCITPGGQTRVAILDRMDLARLIAQAASANLILTSEEATR